MKLLLINPFDRQTCAYSNHFPPLGLGYLAALTPPEWDIELIDENFETFVPQQADLIAITAMTIQINRVYEICRIYRKRGTPVVLGGIHASMMPEEALQFADSVLIGEAETLWPKLIQDFAQGKLKRIYRRSEFHDLSRLVTPRRDLFHRKYLFDGIQTSRGCPFRCDFCSVPVLNGRKYRLRPVDEVIEELKTIRKKFLFFVDDNIVGIGKENEARAVALFEAMLRHKIKKRWISQASLNVVENTSLLKLMKRTGCLGLLIGFETLDKEKLKHYGKTQNLNGTEDTTTFYREVIAKLHAHGIAVNGYFCFGYEDTPASILSTLKFILQSRIDIVNTPIIVPSPGTPLFEKLQAEIEYQQFPQDWSKFLGQLVYRPRKTGKEQFYRAYRRSAVRLNSIPEILNRSLSSLRWSKDPLQSLMILLFNLGYRNLRHNGLRHLSQNQTPSSYPYPGLQPGCSP